MKPGLSSDRASCRGGTPEAHDATTNYRSAFPLAIVYCIAAVLSLFWVGLVRVLQLNPLGWLFSWIPCLLFLVWQYRVASNLEVFEVEGVNASPLWNLFCWLVPLANVYLPYEALCEIWQASSPNESSDCVGTMS